MKKAALVSPYWDIMGGAEKYLLNIGLALQQHHYQVEIFWHDEKISTKIKSRFGKNYDSFKINKKWHQLNKFKKLIYTKKYDLIFYHSDGSYFFSLARKNLQLFQVPEKKLLPKNNWLSRLKYHNWTPVFNSRFTQRFFLKHTRVKKHYLLYPLLEIKYKQMPQKQALILSVGRFFGHLHSKKQEILIKAYLNGLKKYPQLGKYKLVLAGGFKESDRLYLNYLKKLCHASPQIEIQTNVSSGQIEKLYQKAAIYWHGAGYKIDDKKNPELVEHFGISVTEAMAAYCVPIVYPAGGPKEIVVNASSGFFFQQPAELIKHTLFLINQPKLRAKMAKAANQRALTKFGPRIFNNSLFSIIK